MWTYDDNRYGYTIQDKIITCLFHSLVNIKNHIILDIRTLFYCFVFFLKSDKNSVSQIHDTEYETIALEDKPYFSLRQLCMNRPIMSAMDTPKPSATLIVARANSVNS